MNIVDIVLILFIVGLALLSAKRGFLLSLLNLGAVVAAGILSRIFASPVSSVFYNAFCHGPIMEKLYEILPAGSVSGQINAGIDSVLSELPDALIAMARQFDLYPQISAGTEVLTVEAIEEEFIIPIVTGVVSIIASVFLFIIFNAILKIAARIINKRITDSDKHKFVHGSNALLGGAVGVVKGIIPAGIVCIVLELTAPLAGGTLAELVGNSYFCGLAAKLLS